MSAAAPFSPVVALDVDGVLRIPEPRPGAGTETIAAEITMRRDLFPSRSHRSPRWDDDGLFTARHFFAATGVEWLRSLAERGMDVRWCTTWGIHANMYFASPLRLPEFPVIFASPRLNETAVEWKVRIIAEATRGRPVLWVDDHAWEEALRYVHTPRALASVRHIDPGVGITAEDVAAMDTSIAMAGSPGGRDELRRQWRRQRDRMRRCGVPPFPPEWVALIR